MRKGSCQRRVQAIAVLAALVTGLACLAHSGWIYAKAVVAQRLISQAWGRAQSGEVASKPWWWADTYPIAKLTLVRGSHELMVLEGANGRNLAFGPTHDPASVLPGERGNSVIEGHRDTHFGVLKSVRVGDRLQVELPGRSSVSFVVTDLRVADIRRSRLVLDSETPRLTLVTCYPFDALQPGGPLRYVVTADWVTAGASR